MMSNSKSSGGSSGGGSGSGVCMMNRQWRDEQNPSFINFVSAFLTANSFRLNFVPISPDFIFNCGGLSVAFIFVTKWDCNNPTPILSRVEKLKGQFANLYAVVCLPNNELNDSFVRSYFKHGLELGRPTFVPVLDMEMGFEKIVKIAHSRGVLVEGDLGYNLAFIYLNVKRRQAVQDMDAFLRVVTSIPGIDKHDANALNQAIGSIEAIAKASMESILENTDLSAGKAGRITRFFRDPNFYLSPKIS